MDNNQKIKFAEAVLTLLKEFTKTEESLMPKHIGYLAKKQGLNGFKVAEIGTPVFEFKDRYLIYLESIDGKRNQEVSYYKETLEPVIDFI